MLPGFGELLVGVGVPANFGCGVAHGDGGSVDARLTDSDVMQLGADSYPRRRASVRDLWRTGDGDPDAVERLRRVKNSGDAEAAANAAEVLNLWALGITADVSPRVVRFLSDPELTPAKFERLASWGEFEVLSRLIRQLVEHKTLPRLNAEPWVDERGFDVDRLINSLLQKHSLWYVVAIKHDRLTGGTRYRRGLHHLMTTLSRDAGAMMTTDELGERLGEARSTTDAMLLERLPPTEKDRIAIVRSAVAGDYAAARKMAAQRLVAQGSANGGATDDSPDPTADDLDRSLAWLANDYDAIYRPTIDAIDRGETIAMIDLQHAWLAADRAGLATDDPVVVRLQSVVDKLINYAIEFAAGESDATGDPSDQTDNASPVENLDLEKMLLMLIRTGHIDRVVEIQTSLWPPPTHASATPDSTPNNTPGTASKTRDQRIETLGWSRASAIQLLMSIQRSDLALQLSTLPRGGTRASWREWVNDRTEPDDNLMTGQISGPMLELFATIDALHANLQTDAAMRLLEMVIRVTNVGSSGQLNRRNYVVNRAIMNSSLFRDGIETTKRLMDRIGDHKQSQTLRQGLFAGIQWRLENANARAVEVCGAVIAELEPSASPSRHFEIAASLFTEESIGDESLRRWIREHAFFDRLNEYMMRKNERRLFLSSRMSNLQTARSAAPGVDPETEAVLCGLFRRWGRDDLEAETFSRGFESGHMPTTLELIRASLTSGDTDTVDEVVETLMVAEADDTGYPVARSAPHVAQVLMTQSRVARERGLVDPADQTMNDAVELTNCYPVEYRATIAEVLLEHSGIAIETSSTSDASSTMSALDPSAMLAIARSLERGMTVNWLTAGGQSIRPMVTPYATLYERLHQLRSRATGERSVAPDSRGWVDAVEQLTPPAKWHHLSLTATGGIEPRFWRYLTDAAWSLRLGDAIGQSDPAAARRWIDRLLTLSPSKIVVGEEIAEQLRDAGMADVADHAVKRLLELGDQHLRRMPHDFNSLNNLAWVAALNDQQLDHALNWSRRAVEIEPDSAIYRDTLAEILFRIGEKEQALQIQRACLVDDPDQWHLHQQIQRFRDAIAADRSP